MIREIQCYGSRKVSEKVLNAAANLKLPEHSHQNCMQWHESSNKPDFLKRLKCWCAYFARRIARGGDDAFLKKELFMRINQLFNGELNFWQHRNDCKFVTDIAHLQHFLENGGRTSKMD